MTVMNKIFTCLWHELHRWGMVRSLEELAIISVISHQKRGLPMNLLWREGHNDKGREDEL